MRYAAIDFQNEDNPIIIALFDKKVQALAYARHKTYVEIHDIIKLEVLEDY